jgi:hypothetical protein
MRCLALGSPLRLSIQLPLRDTLYILARPQYVKRYQGKLIALNEYLELTRRNKNSLSLRYLHFPVALLA